MSGIGECCVRDGQLAVIFYNKGTLVNIQIRSFPITLHV